MVRIRSPTGVMIEATKDHYTSIVNDHLDIHAKDTGLGNIEIPTDPQKFYEAVGLFENQKTRKPVPNLSYYQKRDWGDLFKHQYRLTIKSQKVGITSSSLMEDFQLAILPISNPLSCRGKEILIIAQSLKHAQEHLYTLRKMILNSVKYNDFLIMKPDKLLLRDEVTKVTRLYIKNPDNVNKPTRIIALGPHEGGVWSWKEVKHIHMSDVAASDRVDDTGLFGAAFSRLANTNGTMHIETPPRGQRGSVWDIYKKSKLKTSDAGEAAKFHIREISADMAVEAGVISAEFLEAEEERLGPLYGQYYECNFINPYTSWYDEKYFRYSDDISEKVGV